MLASLGVATDVAATEYAEQIIATLPTAIVTARKREELLAAVPISITAMSAEALTAYDIRSFGDYASKAPNVSYAYGRGDPGVTDARTVAIRGITNQNFYGTAGATGLHA